MNYSLTPEKIAYFRKNPSKACEILLNIKLTWFQRIMVRTAFLKCFVIWICSRGLGKSWTAAIWILLHCILYSEVNAAIYAVDFPHAKAIFKKIIMIYKKSPYLRSVAVKPPKLSKELGEFTLKNGSYIICQPFRLGERHHIIAFDEAKLIDFSEFNTVVYPMISDPHPVMENKILLCSSASYAGDPFHVRCLDFEKYIKEGNSHYGICSFNVYDALTGPYMNKTMVDEAKRQLLDEEFQTEFENIFVNLADGWIRGPLIRSSELPYRPEYFGEPGFSYLIGADFGRVKGGDNTSLTVFKIIPDEGVRVVRNVALNGVSTPKQSLILRQLIKDYGGKDRGMVEKIIMDHEKLGYAVADSLLLPDIDPRDGEKLLPITYENDYDIPEALRIINGVNFADRTKIFIMASNTKKGLESGILHFPEDAFKFFVSDEEKQALDKIDKELVELYQEITELKREICNIEVQSNGKGSIDFIAKGRKHDDRFTSFYIGAAESIEFYNKLCNKDNVGSLGVFY